MNLQLKGKRVFISGSTAGIGFCTAQTFLKEGAIVYINGRTQKSVNKAVSQLENEFPDGEIVGIAADFADAAAVQSLIEQLPAIDILINNVGIYTSQSFVATSDEDWQRQFEVNVMSGVRLARHFLPIMLQKNWGRMLFISSECATLVPADLIAYSCTKAALLAVSRGLAQLTKGSGVTVNAILPGSTMTEGAEQFLANLAQQENKTIAQAEADFFTNIRTSSLLQRFAKVEEIAHSIVYFASPLAAATNGAAIKLDGGSTGGIL
jgi:NAD(P)-dependent dehydrogenase (short-subunit alcohol dehydrogenase family)